VDGPASRLGEDSGGDDPAGLPAPSEERRRLSALRLARCPAPEPAPLPSGDRDLGLSTPAEILARAAPSLRTVGILPPLPPPAAPGSPAVGGGATVASVTVAPGAAGVATALDEMTSLLAKGVTVFEVFGS
jgi:hypothetical protein